MVSFYNLSTEERSDLGKKGRQHVLDNYGFDSFASQWIEVVNRTIEKHGSWENRKNYKHWSFTEL